MSATTDHPDQVVVDLLVDLLDRSRGNALAAVDGMSEEDLAWRPGPEANPVGWLVWHLARVQDDHVAALAGSEQVWTGQGFAERFALPYDEGDIGYGQTSEEVGALRVDADRLAAYVEAVHARSVAWLRSGADGSIDWTRVVDEHWDPPVTVAVRLVSVADDCAQHAGQAAYVRGLLGR